MLVSDSKRYSCALYCRLSNEDELQDESRSITNQKDLLEKYAKENNLDIYDIYVDDGYSGTNFNRPAFQRMIRDIEDKKVNMVIVKDSSRLGRDYIQFGEYVEKYFPQNKVRVVSILDNYDSEIDNGVADTLPFRAVMNDFYAKDTSKKVRSTKLKNAKQGLFMGRYAPFGYEKSKEDKHKLVINEEQAKLVRRIFDLYLSGKSTLQILYILVEEKVPTPSQQMNMQRQGTRWYRRVISSILQNEMYIGNMVQCRKRKVNYKLKKVIDVPKKDWVRVEGTHEPIIEKEKFYAVQRMIASKGETRTKSINILLRGLVYCKDCGRKMSPSTDGSSRKRNVYLRCVSYANAPRLGLCTSHSIRYDLLEDVVLTEVQRICKKYLDRNKIKKNMQEQEKKQDEEETAKKEKNITIRAIELLGTQIDKLYEDKLNGLLNDEDFKRLYDKKTAEREMKKKYLEELESTNIEKKTIDYEKVMNDFLKKENITSYMLTTLIEKIEVDKQKNITIYYKFNPLNSMS